MELNEFTNQLKERMETEIEAISADQADVLKRTSMLIRCVERHAGELKRFVVKYRFKSVGDEIAFFKQGKPEFMTHLFYFRSLFKIQLFELNNSNQQRLRFYQTRLRSVQQYLERHHEFYRYVLSGSDDCDTLYFTRKGAPHPTVVLDERFSTGYDDILSRTRSIEMTRSYILEAIRLIENPGSDPKTSTLTWTGAKTDLVELIYALQASEVFNKGNAGVKQIASQFEGMFNVSLGNYYRVFQEIRLRKRGQTNFLDRIKHALENKMSEGLG